MAEVSTGITEACEAFLAALDEGRFYDAHEDLEHLWYPRRFEEDDEVKLWRGFINAAVSFELIKRGREKPSAVAWKTYQKYLPILETLNSPYYPIYVTIRDQINALHAHLTPKEL